MKIGVTGIFASGKGTVSGMFAELGAYVIDTDEITRVLHKMQLPWQESLKRVVAI